MRVWPISFIFGKVWMSWQRQQDFGPKYQGSTSSAFQVLFFLCTSFLSSKMLTVWMDKKFDFSHLWPQHNGNFFDTMNKNKQHFQQSHISIWAVFQEGCGSVRPCVSDVHWAESLGWRWFWSVWQNREKTNRSCSPLQLETALRADGQGDELGIIYILEHVQADLPCCLLFSITKHLLIELGQQGGIPHTIPRLTKCQD